MKINTLLGLSVRQIEHDPLPLTQLLKDSLYYPACDIDGEVIRYCNLHFEQLKICSFIYADYGTGEERLNEHLDGFLGYHLLATREIMPEDVGANMKLAMPEDINPEEYIRYQDVWHQFARWAVFERDEDRGDNHGPKRFSLLYLGGEGIATYSGLYLRNNITPKAIALIQPGHAFGLNWTNFWDWNGPLARTVRMGKSLPKYYFFGGYGFDGYNVCPWPGYNRIDRVDHYCPDVFDSALTVWKGDIISLRVYDGKRDGNYGVTLQIMDNPRTLPHEFVDHVFVEYRGQQYEASIGSYQHGDTLRGANTIKELIQQNQWIPGKNLICVFTHEWGIHSFIIIED